MKSSELQSKAAPARLLDRLKGDRGGQPVFWFMRQAGRYLPEYRKLRAEARDFLDLCYNSEMAAEATLQPLRRFDMDGAILFADILLLPHALGQDVCFRAGEGPVLAPITGPADLDTLHLDGLHDRLAPVYETIARVSRVLPAGKTLIGFAGAPWTVATYMVEGGTSRDHLKVRRWALGDSDGFGRLIDCLVEATSAYLIAQVGAGARVLQIFDTWAGVLPVSQFERWCIAPMAAIVGAVKKACPEVPIIGFPRGAGPLYADYVRRTGVDGISIDSGLAPAWAAAHLQGRAVVQGNLDPLALLEGGEVMLGEAARILESLGSGGHVFNLGHGIQPQTPPDHVARLCDFLRAWRPDCK